MGQQELILHSGRLKFAITWGGYHSKASMQQSWYLETVRAE